MPHEVPPLDREGSEARAAAQDDRTALDEEELQRAAPAAAAQPGGQSSGGLINVALGLLGGFGAAFLWQRAKGARVAARGGGVPQRLALSEADADAEEELSSSEVGNTVGEVPRNAADADEGAGATGKAGRVSTGASSRVKR